MSPYFRNLLKSIGHDYMAPDARVYNTKQYLDGGRVGFENGTRAKPTEEQIKKKNLRSKEKYREDLVNKIDYRKQKTENDIINLKQNWEKTVAKNPGLKEAHINNLYREVNGKFFVRPLPLRPFKEVFADFGIKPGIAKEFSSLFRKELKADGLLGMAKRSDIKDRRNKNIKEGKADAGPTVRPVQKKLETQILNYNKIYSDLLEKDPKKLVKTIRQKDNLMDQLESVFKDGGVKKEKISDDEIKKLVKNGLYSEDHKTQVQTGSKNIEYNVNKSFVTKKTNSSVLAPMTMWLNKNYKLVDGEVKDPKIKNIKNWLTKNNINTKIEGLGTYFGDDSLKKISAEAAYQKQLNFLETSSSKLGKTLKLAKATGKKLLQALNVLGQPSIAAGFGVDELRKGNIKTAGSMLLAPEFVGSFAPAGKGILSTIGRVAANPFGKAVRAFTPVGLATIAGGAGYDVYKETKRRQELTDEERLQEDIEAQAKDDEMMVGAAEGGFIEN